VLTIAAARVGDADTPEKREQLSKDIGTLSTLAAGHMPMNAWSEQLAKGLNKVWSQKYSALLKTAAALVLLIGLSSAEASTTCTTRKSGSVTITSCSDSGHNSNYRQCRSYKSGNTIKTSCR
jgi:hypothetical protein